MAQNGQGTSGHPFAIGQVSQYFNFVNAVMLNNVVMTAWALLAWLPHALTVASKLRAEGVGDSRGIGRSGAADILYLSTFQPSSDRWWGLS